MITIDKVRKSFGGDTAVANLSLTIQKGQVFGLVGTNGAGKSTLLRMTAGVLEPDSGSITIDNLPVFDNPAAKSRVYFISDEPYFFSNSSAADMLRYMCTAYPHFDADRFRVLLGDFGLDPKRPISHYSKGMKKQLAVICGIAANTDYLLCDETFDGLDPVMRQGTKSLFAQEMTGRGLTPVIASHNLRELEDICDHIGLLHRGGLLLSEDLADMKLGIQKVQCVFKNEREMRFALAGLRVVHREDRGRLITLIVRGERDEIIQHFKGVDPVFFEILPLTLEEIFICETEVAGYDARKLILG